MVASSRRRGVSLGRPLPRSGPDPGVVSVALRPVAPRRARGAGDPVQEGAGVPCLPRSTSVCRQGCHPADLAGASALQLRATFPRRARIRWRRPAGRGGRGWPGTLASLGPPIVPRGPRALCAGRPHRRGWGCGRVHARSRPSPAVTLRPPPCDDAGSPMGLRRTGPRAALSSSARRTSPEARGGRGQAPCPRGLGSSPAWRADAASSGVLLSGFPSIRPSKIQSASFLFSSETITLLRRIGVSPRLGVVGRPARGLFPAMVPRGRGAGLGFQRTVNALVLACSAGREHVGSSAVRPDPRSARPRGVRRHTRVQQRGDENQGAPLAQTAGESSELRCLTRPLGLGVKRPPRDCAWLSLLALVSPPPIRTDLGR